MMLTVMPRHRILSILHQSPKLSSNNYRGKIWTATNFGWKYYWNRANDGNRWNSIMLRSFHHYAVELQNDKNKSQSRYSPLTLTQDTIIVSSCRYMRLPSLLHLSPMMTKSSQWKVFIIRGMSSSPITTAATTSTKKGTTTVQQSEEVGDQHVELESLPASQRVRLLFKKYGMVFVGTYLTLYWTVLLTFFFSLDSGILDPDVLSQLFKVSKNFACETADIIGPTGM